MQAFGLEGTSIVIDFPLPAFPQSMGHWTEVMAPIFCMLSSTEWQQATSGAPLRNLIFANLARADLTVRTNLMQLQRFWVPKKMYSWCCYSRP